MSRLAAEIVDPVGDPQILADVVVRRGSFLTGEIPDVSDFDSDILDAAVCLFNVVECGPEELDFQKILVVISVVVSSGSSAAIFSVCVPTSCAGGVPRQRHL